SSFMNRTLSAVGPISTATPVPPEDASQPSAIHSFLSRFHTALEEGSAATPTPTSLPSAPEASATPAPTEDVSDGKPQPMDGIKFLHRFMFALDLLDCLDPFLAVEPEYAYSIALNEGYLRSDILLVTLDHLERTVRFIDCSYVIDGEVYRGICQYLPAALFALGDYDIFEEYESFYKNQDSSFLRAYKDPNVSLELIRQIQKDPISFGNYHIKADNQSFRLIFQPLGFNAASRFETAPDKAPADAPGMDLYCFYIRYSCACNWLGILRHGVTPVIGYSPDGYICYHFSSKLETFANRNTGIEQNPQYYHKLPFEEIPLEDLKDVLAIYFALCGRTAYDDLHLDESEWIIKEYTSADQLRPVIQEYFAPGNIVGDYRTHTQHYTNKSAKTHTYFGAGVNYDR
ncbi:MAG: hypothetical protein IJF65_00350, partial [Clostridia bacterium]|nr:hypothetical protein [Clostridia bacterium]